MRNQNESVSNRFELFQTEYQRNFQRRTPKRADDPPVEARRLIDGEFSFLVFPSILSKKKNKTKYLVPIKRSSSSSPSRRRAQTAFVPAERKSTNFAVIGPNDKFANSQLYRLRQPIQNSERVPKPKEYAILGRNEKFQENVAYPLRKPVVDDPPAVREENHPCTVFLHL